MRGGKRLAILMGLALVSSVSAAVAEVPQDAVTPTVVVLGTEASPASCKDLAPEAARVLADKASHDRDYQRAGECYLAAGEQSLADQAFVKAAAHSKDDTTHKLAANLDEVKAQARQMKQAFQRR